MTDQVRMCRVAVVFFLALGCASRASAFDYPIHVDVTKEGLANVIEEFIRSLGQSTAREDLSRAAGTRVTTFTPKAVQEITDANKAQDTDDCGNKEDRNIPAQPCSAPVGGERGSALWHLNNEPAWEHFDGEEIQRSSDAILNARREIIALLGRGQYIGARKRLGHALHAIQDFYSHTNYVEMGNHSPNIDRRIGAGLDSFASGRPRLAAKNEATCLQGEFLFTNDLKTKLTNLLHDNPISDVERGRQIADALALLTRMLNDPDGIGLTSGYFRFTQMFGDPDAINAAGKCRHGYEAVAGQPLSGQPGINKDTLARDYHALARALATDHTANFIVGIFGAVLGQPNLTKDQKYAAIVGLMGYESLTMMTKVTVGIPGAPNGESWDTAIGSALGFFVRGTQGLKNIQPDVLVCMESATVPGVCLPLCDDADWSNELNAYVCSQPVNFNGWGTRVESDLRVLVREVDLGEPRRVIANFRVEDPRACDPFCSLDLEPGATPPRTVWIRFDLGPVAEYAGPRRARQPLPPAAPIPIAKPASSTQPPPSSTGTPGSTQTSTAIASSTTTGSSLLPSTTTAASRTTSSAAAPLRSVEGIDSRLALRDADNCAGADAFYTGTAPASLTGAQGEQLYQMAAFSMAIADTTLKQSVLNAIRAKVGDDAFYTAMTAVIADPLRSQTLVTSYTNTARNVAQKISASGLASLLPMPVPPSAMQANVDRWILARLSSPALVSTAIDLMSGARPLTAECTVNELAKQGFTAAVLP
jgi:hypothetical protein